MLSMHEALNSIAYVRPWVPCPALLKPGLVEHVITPIQETEARDSEFRTILSYGNERNM